MIEIENNNQISAPKWMIKALINDFIDLFKDSSIVDEDFIRKLVFRKMISSDLFDVNEANRYSGGKLIECIDRIYQANLNGELPLRDQIKDDYLGFLKEIIYILKNNK